MTSKKKSGRFAPDKSLPYFIVALLVTSCQVGQAPSLTASFTYSPASPVSGQAVQFTDTSTGAPTSWQWSFGDGATSTTKSPSHAFQAVASYTVTLVVSNSSASKNASKTIDVLPSSALAASFSYSPTSPLAGHLVQFTDTSTGMPTSWQWDFGDSSTSTAQNPSHTYTALGSYLVTLAIRAESNSNSTSQTIAVRQSNVITAASPSLADVGAAISSATYGDTVIVPAGSAAWSSRISLTKGVSIIGAGMGNTIITQTAGAFSFTPNSTQRAGDYLLRISGFTFVGSGGSVIRLSEDNFQTVPTRTIRIDHNSFAATGTYPIDVNGNFWGVIDNNQFGGNLAFSVMGTEASSWKTFYPPAYGTADNLYFEDNTFTGTSEIYVNSGHGGRYAFRHNTFTCTKMGNPLFDQHGSQTYLSASGGPLGGASYNVYALMLSEIYDNTFTGMTSGVNRWNYQRGGKLLFYNNTGISTGGPPNITESDPSADRGTANIPPPIYTPYDCYFWNNAWNGTRINAMIVDSDFGCITENVTFWNQKDGFDGTAGIGVGSLSARPTTCTIGVAYWATDTNILYKATATNTWAAYYTPYTYPHPLRK